MDFKQLAAIDYTVQHKVKQINKMADDARFEDAFNHQRELFGMIEIITALGYDVRYDRSAATGWNAVCEIRA